MVLCDVFFLNLTKPNLTWPLDQIVVNSDHRNKRLNEMKMTEFNQNRIPSMGKKFYFTNKTAGIFILINEFKCEFRFDINYISNEIKMM